MNGGDCMKNNKMKVLTSLEATRAQRERFNPFQTGYGAHKTDKKPSRARSKELLRKEMAY